MSDNPVHEEPNESNVIAELILYRDSNYGVNVKYQYDERKFQCPDALAESIMKKAGSRLMELLRRNGLFGFKKGMKPEVINKSAMINNLSKG